MDKSPAVSTIGHQPSIDQSLDFTYDCGAMPTPDLPPPSIALPGDLSRDLSPYACRWIALVRGHVAGVGLASGEARALAKSSRPKEEPVVVFVPKSPA